jgi:hypothetical protein
VPVVRPRESLEMARAWEPAVGYVTPESRPYASYAGVAIVTVSSFWLVRRFKLSYTNSSLPKGPERELRRPRESYAVVVVLPWASV